MKDLFGQALLDFHNKSSNTPLLLHSEYGPPEAIPLERFFRSEYTDLENFALDQVKGNILDIGAATGRHALHLQNQGYDVTAMDISLGCSTIIKEIGLNKIITDDIYTFADQKYDTIMMLMNGIGIAGSLEGLEKLLLHLKNIITPTGQLLMDSSDISYLYEGNPLPVNKYFGELSYQYEYKGVLGDSFNWLYIDQQKLTEIANSTGWICQIIFEDETDAYLARLQMK